MGSRGATANLSTVVSAPTPQLTPRVVATQLTDHAGNSRATDLFLGPQIALLAAEPPALAERLASGTVTDPIEIMDAAGPLAESDPEASVPPVVATGAHATVTIAAKAWMTMVREGKDQLVSVHSTANSAQNQVQHAVIEQLLRCSAATTKPGSGDPPGVSTAAYKPGSSRLHTDVIKAHLLMEALLTASTATGTPVLRAGLVTEMQFDARGALVGAKLCEYHLETMRAGSPPGSESNFHALYGLVLAAATIPDVKAAYSLNGDVTKYNLLVKGYRACAKNVSAGTYLVMTKCMKALGLKKRFQSSFFGVLAALVHLGNLEFETDARSKSAAACVRNVDVLDTAANLIGIKSDTLQGLFTTKTVVVGDSAYTDFLSPVEARETLERFVSTVYSTLVVYILDLANRKLSNEQALVSSVTVAAMGGVESTHANAAHQLCRNYATERMNQFVLQRLADSAREMGVAADLTNGLATAVGSAGAVSLLDELFDTLERETARAASATEAKRAAAVTAAGLAVPTSPTSVSSVNVLDTLNAKYSGHTAYARAPGDVASGFCVRHSTGSVTYSITATLQNLSSGMLPAQWITACRSDATSNAVLRQAFSEQRIVTITSVKRAKTIVAGRAANLRRTLTTKNKTQGLRERKATLLSKTQRPGLLQPGSPIKGPDSPGNTAMSAEDDESDVPLSRLSSTIVGQSRAMVDRMFSTLGSCRAWQVTVAPTSAITEDVARGLALAPLIAVVRAANGAFAAWPTADLAELFPGLCATAGGTEPNTIIESLKQICPHLYPIVDPNDQEGATYKSVLAREHEWLALEAAEYKIRGATDGPFRVEVNPLMFAKVQDRAQREKSRSGADSGGETDDDAVSTTGTAITMDDLELGALDPVEADAREAAARAVANGEKPVDPKKVEARKAKEAAKAARKKLTPIRRRWMCATTCMTWWIPDMFLNWDAIKKTTPKQAAEIRQSWREKVALCIIIAFLSALMIFFITGFSALMCPNFNMLTLDELYKGQRLPTTTSKLYAMHGNVYDLTAYPHPGGSGFAPQEYSNMRGTDVSGYFPRWNPTTGDVPTVCKATSVKRRRDLSSQDSVDTPVVVAAEATSGTSHSLERRANVAGMNPTKCIASSASVNATGYCHSYSAFAFKVSIKDPALNVAVSVKVAWAMTDVGLRNTDASRFIVVSGKVYDVTLLLGTTSPFTTAEKQLFAANGGRDITSFAANYINIPCLDAIAYVGVVDNRDYLVCNISSYILKAVTYIMVAVMVIKFLSALQLGKKRTPEDINKYVIMQVPCYSESVDSLKKTIDSLAVTTYDDTRKLLFIVADGMIKGSGNEKPTPDLVLDILGVPDSHRDVASFSYHSIGDGSKAHNKVRIYSGLYHIHGRAIPYLVVIKCGTETETAKAGNRGKRDSQMILMRWFNRVILNLPMTPAELEMYRHIRNVIGVQPANYEYVLMVDADTEVAPDCLTRLVSACMNDSKIMGLCGETRIANEKQSWITAIQVYEYYISHHLAKAFESLFGSVTCLPGCFSMYKLYQKKGDKKVPVLVDSGIIHNYSESVVDTLHKKNLLMLGEDRYLTTLMLQTFPELSMKFTPDSYCLTIVPDKFAVLLSQRRRWINSTIHNLFELSMINDLCGCLIFSMRFVVVLDLFATLVMPASVAYLGYLIYTISQNPGDNIMIIYLIAATYAMQAVIFLVKRQWQHIGWMIVHFLAMPVFYMYIPLYSFWHFDDFSWGQTRRVEGDSGKGGHEGDDEKFDPASIPTAKWDEYKKVKRQEASLEVSAKAVRETPGLVSGSKSNLAGSRTGSLENLRSATTPSSSGMPKSASIMGGARANNGSQSGLLMAAGSVASLTDVYRTNVYAASGAVGSGMGFSPSMGNLWGVPASAGGSASGNAAAEWGPSASISDQALMDQVRVIIYGNDLASLTKKRVRTLLTEHFGVDLASRREIINNCVDVTLLERMSSDPQ